MSDPTTFRARLCLIGAATLWSLSGPFAKTLALPGPTMACGRVLFAGVALLPFLRGRSLRWRAPMLGLILCFTIMNVSFVTAMTLTTAANAIFLQYTAPIWMFLASRFLLKEALDRKSLESLGIGLVGIAVILVGNSGGDGGQTLGIVLALLAGAAYGGIAIFLRVLRDEDAVWLTVLEHLAAGLILLPFLPLFPGSVPLTTLSTGSLAGLCVFGVLQMGVPYILFSRGLKSVGPQEAGTLTLLEPVLNPVLTFLVMGELPSIATMVGGAIVLAGVAWRYRPAAD